MSDEKDEGSEIRVTDRRRFSESGEARTGDDAPEREGEPAADAGAATMPAPVSFSTFVLGLSAQALMHLGEVEHPEKGKHGRDLPAAKHVIDILGVLEAKTAGNLDTAEQSLMESMLYDLRMRYVALTRDDKDTPKEEA